jgi:hypothetical protein
MEPKLVMFGRSNSTRSRRGGYAKHVFRLAGLAAAALLAFTISTIGQSQACPKHHKESRETVAAVVHEHAARSAFVATALPFSPAKEVDHGNCCGRGHCNGIVGSTGCCPACTPALAASAPALTLDRVIRVYVLPPEAGLSHSRPPPEFRPPRTFA